MHYSLQHLFIMSWLVLFPGLQEQQLHCLLFLLEQHAVQKLSVPTAAGIDDFVKQGRGVLSRRVVEVLQELRSEGLLAELELTAKGKEVFRNLSSVLLYDPLYSLCVPFAERYRRDYALIQQDIGCSMAVVRSKHG